MNRTTRRAFDQAAEALNTAFEQAGPFPGQEATPFLLSAEAGKCLDICRKMDAGDELLPPEEIDELGTHALECLSDLGLWAWQLELDEVRAILENTAFELALWIGQHGGTITVLEPVVNALARQANATHDPAALGRLFDDARCIIAAAPGPDSKADTTALQPWLTLHFNCAIIATRTLQPDLMNAAYDLLETRLPRHCRAFYEEGLREADKPAYGGHVREMMRERLAKWTA